jgi:hypothetical protein
MSTHTQDSPRSHRPSPAAILIVPLAVAVVLTLFAWPNARLEPRDLPVGVAGPPPAARAVEQRLAAREGAFDIRRYADEAAARRAIEDREVYGAFVATPAGATVLTASAASPTVAQLLTRAASEARPRAARVQDVVPATPAAPALPASVLPLLIAGILTGAAGAHLASRGPGRVGLILAGSVLAGLAAVVIVQAWLDVVEGDWVANAAVLGLTVLAIASPVAGLFALLGARGAILAALTMILIGNPFSAVGTAPELLPEPAGAIGQLLPPGAGGNLLRSTGYFDGAAAGDQVLILVLWSLAGMAALLAASVRGRRPAPAGAAVPSQPGRA